jgi:transketolase
MMVNEGKDVSIFATGHLVWEAILAGEILEKEGIDAENHKHPYYKAIR